MLKKLVLITPRSIQQDTAVNAFPNDTAASILNMRLNTSGDKNTTYGISNEKGNSAVTFKSDKIEKLLKKEEIIVGVLKLNDIVILFTFNTVYTASKNRILKVKPSNEIILLYLGDLGIVPEHPIESIGVYETKDVQKVYWVDGIHLLRFINVAKDKEYSYRRTFDIVSEVNTKCDVEIEKSLSGGKFPAGVILYAFSYYRKNGEETPLIYVSPINYLSNDSGISPDKTCTNSFTISIKYIDDSFDYIRLYSIVRTSLNSQVESKIVKDIDLSDYKGDGIKIIDTGNEGRSIDSNLLLFLNKYETIPGTISSKDNTLFIGNILIPSNKIKSSITDDEITGVTITPFLTNNIIESSIKNENYNGLLKNNSSKISSFKWDEYYYFGVLFKDKKGNLSEVVPLKAVHLNLHPDIDSEENVLSTINFQADLTSLDRFIPDLYRNEVRLMVAQHNPNTYRVLGQGILCPTVFRLGDRMNNSPYVLSSWIMRSAGHHGESLNKNSDTNGEILSLDNTDSCILSEEDLQPESSSILIKYFYKGYLGPHLGSSFIYNIYEGGDKIKEEYSTNSANYSDEFKYSQIVGKLKKDLAAEDWAKIPSLTDWTSHSNISPGEITIDSISIKNKVNNKINKQRNNFYIDDSIITFHSPEINNFIDLIDKSTKLRIIGILKDSDFKYMSNYKIIGGNRLRLNSLGELNRKFKTLKSNLLWNDSYEISNDNFEDWVFATYMWHRTGSLNADDKSTKEKERKSVLQSKIFLNTLLANNIEYLENPWINSPDSIKVFNQDLVIATPLNSEDSIKYYYGNIDSIISPSISDDYKGYNIYGKRIISPYNAEKYNKEYIEYDKVLLNNLSEPVLGTDPISIKYKSTPHTVIKLSNNNKVQEVLPYNTSLPDIYYNYIWNEIFPIKCRFLTDKATSEEIHQINTLSEKGDYWFDSEVGFLLICISKGYWTTSVKDPKMIEYEGKYYSTYKVYYTIPGIEYETWKYALSKPLKSNLHRDIILSPIENRIYVAELYKDINPYSSKNFKEKDLLSLTWIPAGDFTKSFTEVIADRGDTYYLRWDCLKTIPFSPEDPNQVIDITSFMVESHINLDGRYDRRRYEDLTIDGTNFNKINPIYSQEDNFFLYNIVDFNEELFPNLVMWSRPKKVAEEIDSWTNINPTNSLDLDGDKGVIQSLNKLNNEIYAFLDSGISRILFNSRAAITPSDGVPIEIANGGKVDGKVYISNKYGCQNKWSIAETPSGIYFADNNTNGLYLFNGQNIVNISDSKGMYSWVKNNITNNVWDPKNFLNIRTIYDSSTGDIYFTTKDIALAFNEKMQSFTSFYSYGNVSWNTSLNGLTYLINNNTDNKIWSMHTNSKRCNFFGNPNKFNILIIANPEFLLDKVFDTIEFRTNDLSEYDVNSAFKVINNKKANYYPFLTIKVENEYLKGTGDINTLRKKFRTWRWQLPRNNKNNKYSRDRIRNPWASIDLICDEENSERELMLYDIVVNYYV